MSFSLSPLHILLFVIILITFFYVFMSQIYPRYFEKPSGGIIKGSARRGAPLIIDKDMPGGQGVVVSRESYPNGEIHLILMNATGRFSRIYWEDEIKCMNIGQVMCDKEPALFIVKTTRFAESELSRELIEAEARKREALKQRDAYKTEHEELKANKDAQVDKEVDRMKNAMQANKPDWNKAPR
jgi:hypothetical protein